MANGKSKKSGYYYDATKILLFSKKKLSTNAKIALAGATCSQKIKVKRISEDSEGDLGITWFIHVLMRKDSYKSIVFGANISLKDIKDAVNCSSKFVEDHIQIFRIVNKGKKFEHLEKIDRNDIWMETKTKRELDQGDEDFKEMTEDGL